MYRSLVRRFARTSGLCRGAHNMAAWQPYHNEVIKFTSAGDELVGRVFSPSCSAEDKLPAVIILGPVASTKEQVPTQYATRLATHGLLSMVFDCRTHGESQGEPRRFEDGDSKVADVGAAVDWVLGQPSVDSESVFLVGICQGVNWVLRRAVQDDRVKGIAMISGNYLTPTVSKMMLGDAYDSRLEAARESKSKFESTGEVDYIQVVQQVEGEDALLSHPPPRDYYVPWLARGPWVAHKGQWENRITRMSEATLWTHDVYEDAAKLQTPVLMVHADNSANGKDMPKHLFEQLSSENKQLEWFGSTGHLQFYDDPVILDSAAARLAHFFKGLSSH